jgi:metal-sulfur cluster biosynthetic enzyme
LVKKKVFLNGDQRRSHASPGRSNGPEIDMNVVQMGLIYDVRVKGQNVEIDMTLTNPACPMSGFIMGEVEKAASQVDGVKKVKVNLVWDPPWTPEMIKQ